MRGRNLIFDFETLGTNLIDGFPILDIAYFTFDADRFIHKPYTFEELTNDIQYVKFNVADYCMTYGYKPEKSTVDWWSNQDKVVRDKIKPKDTDVSVLEFADRFLAYLDETQPNFWWSRGNTFDPIIMYRIFNDLKRSDEFNKFCPHWAVRDVRTFIDTKFDFNPKIKNGFVLPEWTEKFNAHDSVHDVAVDILRLQTIIKAQSED